MKDLLVLLMALASVTVHAQGWREQQSGVQYALNSVAFFDPLNGWAVGNGPTILHTTNGGITWGQSYLQGGFSPSYYMTKILFTTANEGWVFGREGSAYRTMNAGVDWITVSTGTAEDLYGAFFASPARGWAVGDRGLIIATTDQGATWLQQTVDSCDWLYGIHFVDSLYGWAVGDDGLILRTIDGGAQWSAVARGIGGWLGDVEFVDRSKGWVTGDSASVWYTADGGATWERQTMGTALTAWDIEFTDSLHGWIAGGTPPGGSLPPVGLILSTTDAGRTWIPQNSGTTVCLFGLSFLDSLTGWAVGESGTILHTSNVGITDVSPSDGARLLATAILDQNYPNPFNLQTIIKYQLALASDVSLKVYDILGKEVARLVDERKTSGLHEVTLDGTGLAGGVYFYQLRIEGAVKTMPMVLLK